MSLSEEDPFHYDREILKNYVLQAANPYEIWMPEGNPSYKYFIFSEHGHIKVDSTYIHFTPNKCLRHECRIHPVKAYAGFKLHQVTKEEFVEISKWSFRESRRSPELNEFIRKLITNIQRYLDVKD
ncbi:UNVERIFIED_CONTAM: hypothetical protein NCL1_35572 [Trichonephila clavipes]